MNFVTRDDLLQKIIIGLYLLVHPIDESTVLQIILTFQVFCQFGFCKVVEKKFLSKVDVTSL